MADYKAWQVLRRHLLGLTWPPAPRLAEEELKKLAKHNSDAPSPSSLLDAAEAARWNAEEGKVSTLIQSASPGLNAPNPTDATVVDVIRISVLYEYIGKLEEANISLSRASKTLAKVQNASPVLQLFIDVASLILSVKQDALQELRVKQLGVCGALGKLPKGVSAGIAHALVADFFLTLGKWNEAESLYTQALPLLGQDTAAGDAHLALATVRLARGKLVEANASLETIHTTLKDQVSSSVRNWTGVVAARIAQTQGRFGDAQQLMEQALAQLKSGPEGHSLAYSSAVIEAATLAVQRGELLKADELLASVASLRRDSAASPLALSYVLALVPLRMRQGAIKEAEAVLVEKLTEQKNRKGATAEFLVAAPLLHSLACVYADSGRVEDAEGLVSDTLAMRRKVLSEDHIGLLADLQLHARILLLTGHDPAADALWNRVIAIATKSGSSFLLGSVHTALGQAHAQRGNIDKAEAALRQGHAARLKAAGNAPCAFLAESGVLLAECDLARERLATAKELARAAVQAAKAAGAVELEGSALLCLSRSLSDHEFAERESTAERAWALRRERQGPAAPRTVEALLALVSAYDLQGKMEEATALLQFALRALKKEHPEMDDPMMVHVTHQLALHYWDMEQSEEAVALATQSVELSKRVFGASHPLTAAVLDGAALIFDDADMGNEADEAKQAAAAIRAQHGAQP